MKRRRKLKVRIYDETHLTDVGGFSLTKMRIFFFCLAIAIVFIALGICVIAFTPLKNSLPGYMRDEQRSATQESILRLDSLIAEYEKNQAFIDNFLTVIDTGREPAEPTDTNVFDLESIKADSILATSKREKEFIDMMQQREKYNVSVLAPLAAEGTRFYPVHPEGVFTEETKNSKQGKIALPKGSTISSIADGKVVSVCSPNLNSIYTIIVQHNNGFMSKLSGSGKPLVAEGENVSGGQPIAMMPGKGIGNSIIQVELWRNGDALTPYQYLK